MFTLSWDELEPAAGEAFNIWMDGSDLLWAKETWGLLEKTGLCSYRSERERHTVIGRFLTLASIYRDWCSIVFEETHGDDPSCWIDGLEVAPIYLGQLIAGEDLSDDADEALEEALQFLLNAERSSVVQALLTTYGGTVADLFVALWRSGGASESEDENDLDEGDADILNDATSEKVAGYAWISEGCPNVRP